MTALATMEQDVAKKKAAQVRNDEAVRIRSDVAGEGQGCGGLPRAKHHRIHIERIGPDRGKGH
jgi:hypothetical protein